MSVSNFRGFEQFSMDALGRVNLITGYNNVGKTALLEALFLLLGGANVSLVATLNSFRGMSNLNIGDVSALRDALLSPLFWNFDNSREITIIGWGDANDQHKVQITLVPSVGTELDIGAEAAFDVSKAVNEISSDTAQLAGVALRKQYTNPEGQSQESLMILDAQGIRVEHPATAWIHGILMPARFRPNPQEDAERFGQMDLEEGVGDLLETLRIIEPRLKRLTTVFMAGVATIYGDVGVGRMIPLPIMGDGIGRFASILLAIASARSGVVLVDEVDTGLHHSVLSKCWRAVGDAARRYNVQVFATTHSLEFVRAAYRAFPDSREDRFRLHRLERAQEGIRAVSYDEEALTAAMQAELEVR